MVFLLVVLGIVIAAVILGLMFLPALIDESAIIDLAQEQVRKATGGELRVEGVVEISLFPTFVLKLGDTSVDMPPQGDGGSRILAEIQSVDVGLSILGVLMGTDEVGDVILNDTDVTLFDELGKPATQIRVSTLKAQRLNLSNNPMGLEGAVEIVNAAGGEPIAITFDGDVRVPEALDMITLDALNTKVTGALTQPINSALSGAVTLTPLRADLDLLLNLPGGDVRGDMIYAALESPQIDLNFNADRLDLDQIQPAGGKDAQTTQASEKPDPKAPPIPVAVGPLKDLDMRLAINAGSLLTAGQEITNAQVLLRVLNGITDIKYVRGVMHEGQLDTTMQIDVREPVIKATVAGSLKGFELNSLLTSVGKSDTAAGYVDMDWDLATQGTTPEALQQKIDGDLHLSGRNVELTSLSVQDLMCQAIAQANQESLSKPMPTTTKVSALGMIVDFGDGKARLSSVDLATPGVELNGKGEADLQSMNFSARITAKVGEALSQLDPACRVNERYSSMDWPVNCSGNLLSEDQQACKVDVDSILQQLLEYEARNQLQKQAEKLGEKAGSALKKLFGN